MHVFSLVQASFATLSVWYTASFSFGFESSLFSITALMMGAFGEIALASHQIAIMSASTVFMIPYGVSQATAVRVGQGFGANDLAEMHRATFAPAFLW